MALNDRIRPVDRSRPPGHLGDGVVPQPDSPAGIDDRQGSVLEDVEKRACRKLDRRCRRGQRRLKSSIQVSKGRQFLDLYCTFRLEAEFGIRQESFTVPATVAEVMAYAARPLDWSSDETSTVPE